MVTSRGAPLRERIDKRRAVTDVGLACGFSNAASFSRAFKAHFGFAPSQRREPYMGLMPSPFWPDSLRPEPAD